MAMAVKSMPNGNIIHGFTTIFSTREHYGGERFVSSRERIARETQKSRVERFQICEMWNMNKNKAVIVTAALLFLKFPFRVCYEPLAAGNECCFANSWVA